MASETNKLFSKIEIEILASMQGTFRLFTDVPGNAMAQRFTFSVPASSAVNGALVRRTVTSRLPYNTQGHLVQAVYLPGSGQSVLYRARVWGRELPGGQWQWYPLPVIDTPVEFTALDLPIPPTTEEWRDLQLEIPPTTEEWRDLQLPIPPTGEEWHASSLPIKPTGDVPNWLDLEVDR